MGKTKREYSSDSHSSSDSFKTKNKRKDKKHSKKKSKKHKSDKKRKHDSSSGDQSDAWIEHNVDKKIPEAKNVQRDSWMSSDNFFLPTFSKEKSNSNKSATETAQHLVYDPATSSRELNPYYKTGECGMPSTFPSFKKPNELDDYESYRERDSVLKSAPANSWRKPRNEEGVQKPWSGSKCSESPMEKIETMPPEKSDSFKKNETMDSHSTTDILTDLQMNEIGAKMIKAELIGNFALAEKLKKKLERAKMLASSSKTLPQDSLKGKVILTNTGSAGTCRPLVEDKNKGRRPQEGRKKSKNVETHEDGERTKYYPDDGKYDIKQMMSKDHVIHIGKKIYLAIPYYEGLVNHHLVITPFQHIPCSTIVDEDIWEEVCNLKKALTQFFHNLNEDIVFFETVKYLNRRPHMEINCIASRDMEMIQFYFKKAIQESEKSTLNRKLINIESDKNIRRSVPKGLPYFWVDFGSTGMAHIIENQETFPTNFAQEIIGGMLNLDDKKWRKPYKERQPWKRIDYFKSLLKPLLETV
ncbi:CLUMA_CG014982, isoform A [Clunio marinus]|uniref:CLUMA_CG014982, isoform A n=1 Tax=Clunio marinus TaxID=568069 RepID=A0A1J1IRQ4_9DIPT|nr:CLUMA_CG014982, isoform A [Clunio marinus]